MRRATSISLICGWSSLIGQNRVRHQAAKIVSSSGTSNRVMPAVGLKKGRCVGQLVLFVSLWTHLTIRIRAGGDIHEKTKAMNIHG